MLAVTSYSIDWRKCHVCGAIGNGRSPLASARDGTKGISIGVGLPIASVRSPIMLW